MTIYELNKDIQALYDLVTELTTENRNPSEDEETYLRDVYEDIKYNFDKKIDGYCKILKNISSDIDVIDDEIKRLKERKVAKEKATDKIKELIQFGLNTIGEKKYDTGLFSVSICNNPPALNIKNPGKVPQEFLIQQDPKINVSGIKQAIKDGADFDWCELVVGTSLRIK
ncbi:siphovirus Gp157 family protein [Methanobrevibacter sp.]|uniref:siphovirus Gp157 family protein n=1 Tax=Methanobrevibacter sp. TaxID=66852 RepID=UPI003890970E